METYVSSMTPQTTHDVWSLVSCERACLLHLHPPFSSFQQDSTLRPVFAWETMCPLSHTVIQLLLGKCIPGKLFQ